MQATGQNAGSLYQGVNNEVHSSYFSGNCRHGFRCGAVGEFKQRGCWGVCLERESERASR